MVGADVDEDVDVKGVVEVDVEDFLEKLVEDFYVVECQAHAVVMVLAFRPVLKQSLYSHFFQIGYIQQLHVCHFDFVLFGLIQLFEGVEHVLSKNLVVHLENANQHQFHQFHVVLGVGLQVVSFY